MKTLLTFMLTAAMLPALSQAQTVNTCDEIAYSVAYDLQVSNDTGEDVPEDWRSRFQQGLEQCGKQAFQALVTEQQKEVSRHLVITGAADNADLWVYIIPHRQHKGQVELFVHSTFDAPRYNLRVDIRANGTLHSFGNYEKAVAADDDLNAMEAPFPPVFGIGEVTMAQAVLIVERPPWRGLYCAKHHSSDHKRVSFGCNFSG